MEEGKGGILKKEKILTYSMIGFYKTKSTKALFLKILKNMTVLLALYVVITGIASFINSGIGGYMNYFEPLYLVISVTIMSFLVGTYLKTIKKC